MGKQVNMFTLKNGVTGSVDNKGLRLSKRIKQFMCKHENVKEYDDPTWEEPAFMVLSSQQPGPDVLEICQDCGKVVDRRKGYRYIH